jgi:hypothetical protein
VDVAKTVRIEISQSIPTVSVPVSGGVLEVRAPSISADQQLMWRAQRPGWYGGREAVNGFLARCLEPRAPVEEICQLGDPDRRRLMIAVVQARKCETYWRRLYGTTLTPDERFFSVMLWGQQRDAKRLQQRLCEMRQDLISSRLEPIQAVGARIGAGAVEFDKIIGLDRWAKPLSSMAPFRDLFEPLTARVNREIKATGILDHQHIRSRLSPLPETALGLQPTTISGIFESQIKTTSAGLQLGSLGVAAMTSRDKGERGFRGALRLPTPPGVASLIDSVDRLNRGAVKAVGEVHEPRWLSGISGQVAGPQVPPWLDQSWTALGGWRWQQLSRLPRMPMIDGRVRLLVEQGSISHLLPSMGLQADLVANRFPGLLGNFYRIQEALTAAARFGRKWSGDPLWYLLSIFSPRQSQLLVELEREQVYEAIFTALEEVILGSDLVEAVSCAVKEVPYLSPLQRKWLLHGLEHAREGDWDQAIPPLITGFEGALHGSALEANAIEPDTGQLMGPERIIKQIEFGEAFQSFAVRLAFGDRGQPFRHGRPNHDSRDQALLLIVAVIGWLDHALGAQGTYLLASEMKEPLSVAARGYVDLEDSLIAA